jgi:hypothetical protein
MALGLIPNTTINQSIIKKGEDSNFTVEKLGRHHPNQMTDGNVTNNKMQ